MDILKDLANNPDTLFTIEEGPNLTAAVTQLGVERPQLPKNGAITYSNHPTHWILSVMRISPGQPGSAHRVLCFPKSKFSEQEIAKHLDDFAHETLPFKGE
jgi:hypothetical protein